MSASLASRIVSSFGRAPTAPVTFRKTDGTTTSSRAIGDLATPASRDAWRDQQATRSSARVLLVNPDGLTFAPLAGQYCNWEGVLWNVVGAAPYAPAGVPLIWEVTIQR